MLVDMGSRPVFRVVMLDKKQDPAQVAKKDVKVFACAGGEETLSKIGTFDWRPLGQGCYSIRLPASCFRSMGEGIYVVDAADCLTWRSTWQTVSSPAKIRSKQNS